MSNTCCFLTEGGVDVTVDTLQEVGDEFRDCINIRQAWNSSLTADESADTASPTDTGENTPKEHHNKKRKRKGMSGFFRKTWKTVKHLFLCNETSVEPFVPPLNSDSSNPELMSVSCASSLKQRSEGQRIVSESVTGPYWLEETPDAYPAVPENTRDTDSDYPDQTSESENTYETISLTSSKSISLETQSGLMPSESDALENSPKEHLSKGRKRKGLYVFFQRTWKNIRHLFLCNETRVEPIEPPLNRDTHSSNPELMSVPCESSHEQRPDSERTTSESSSDMGCSWIEQDPSCSENTLSSNSEDVYTYYEMGSLLGEGGYGSVYEGTRIGDGQKVAIKVLCKDRNCRSLIIPGHFFPLHTEIALMTMMKQLPISPYVVQLYEWFEDSREITIVMEYPHPCDSLRHFIRCRGYLNENVARALMCQAVLAVQHCFEHGVFNSDIHPGNMLVNPYTLQLKMIDFSCGQLIANGPLSSRQYAGVPAYCPPEILMKSTFEAVPANVWSLGVVLFEMVNGSLPDDDSEDIHFDNSNLSKGHGHQ